MSTVLIHANGARSRLPTGADTELRYQNFWAFDGDNYVIRTYERRAVEDLGTIFASKPVWVWVEIGTMPEIWSDFLDFVRVNHALLPHGMLLI